MKFSLPNKPSIFLFLVAMLPIIGFAILEYRHIHPTTIEDYLASGPVSDRPAAWIESARCTVKTGAFLAMCGPNDEIIPIEQAHFPDDVGFPLILNVQAFLSREAPTRIAIARISLLMNVIGFISLGVVLWSTGHRWLSIAVLVIGARFLTPRFTAPDVYLATPGLFCGVIAGLLSASDALARDRGRTFFWKMLFCWSTLAVAYLFRRPYGMAGIMCFFLPLVMKMFREHRAGTKKAIVSAFAMMCIVFLPNLIIKTRNSLFSITESKFGPPTHAFSHALFIGLNDPDFNPFGIEWNDWFGSAYALKKNPEAVYLTKKYVNLMWVEYFRLLLSHPKQSVGIYKAKLFRVLDRLHLGVTETISILLSILFLIILQSQKNTKLNPSSETPILIGVYCALIALQGVLAWPEYLYFFPAYWGFVLYRLSCFEICLRHNMPSVAVCVMILTVFSFAHWLFTTWLRINPSFFSARPFLITYSLAEMSLLGALLYELFKRKKRSNPRLIPQPANNH